MWIQAWWSIRIEIELKERSGFAPQLQHSFKTKKRALVADLNPTFLSELENIKIIQNTMAGTGPRVARTPLELLNNQETNTPTFLSKWWNPMAAGTVCVVAVIVGNYATRRPVFSGIQKHALALVAGVAAGRVIDNWRNNDLATRDAIFRHYIELHPEDFPPYEQKLYRDVFEPWVPIR